MSGRTRHLREGKLITNRKTDRRQSPVRPLLERLHELNDKCRRRYPDERPVRVGFKLRKDIAAFVSFGQHGSGVYVLPGFVQLTAESAEQCFQRARGFLSVCAKDKPPVVEVASITHRDRPDEHYSRWMIFADDKLVICGGNVTPKVFEAA